MVEQYTIAEARDNLTKIVRRAETKAPVIFTRRGRPVAVLMSYEEFNRRTPSTSFLDAVEAFRAAKGDFPPDLADSLDGVRDTYEGREVPL